MSMGSEQKRTQVSPRAPFQEQVPRCATQVLELLAPWVQPGWPGFPGCFGCAWNRSRRPFTGR